MISSVRGSTSVVLSYLTKFSEVLPYFEVPIRSDVHLNVSKLKVMCCTHFTYQVAVWKQYPRYPSTQSSKRYYCSVDDINFDWRNGQVVGGHSTVLSVDLLSNSLDAANTRERSRVADSRTYRLDDDHRVTVWYWFFLRFFGGLFPVGDGDVSFTWPHSAGSEPRLIWSGCTSECKQTGSTYLLIVDCI